MKTKTILLAFILMTQFYSQAQNDALFQTWRLTYMSVELDSDYNVENVTPPINTTFTVNTDFTFEGDSGCNSYGGSFIYNDNDDTFVTQNLGSTLLGCEEASHQEIEDTYYYYLGEFGSQPMTYEIWEEDDESMTLIISMQIPGFDLRFTNNLLAVQTENLNEYVVYPNPVSNFLQIKSPSGERPDIIIYDTQGKKVLNIEKSLNTDISHLLKGIYFAEILIENKKKIIKFIKS